MFQVLRIERAIRKRSYVNLYTLRTALVEAIRDSETHSLQFLTPLTVANRGRQRQMDRQQGGFQKGNDSTNMNKGGPYDGKGAAAMRLNRTATNGCAM